MKKRYRIPFLIALVLIVPMLYWLPSYGMLFLASLIAVIFFSAGVSFFMLVFASIEKIVGSLVGLFRKGWRAGQPHTSIMHHQ
jgi:hypothetical protein